jgi:hypothetical protein
VSGTNTLLLVQVVIQAHGPADTVSSATYNGIALTRAIKDQDTSSNHGTLETWYLVNPPTGTNNVVVAIADTVAQVLHVGAISYKGVNQSTPIGATNSLNQGTLVSSHSISLATTSAGSLVVDLCESYSATGTVITPGAGQNQRWTRTDNFPTEVDDLATTTAGTYTMSYTTGTQAHSADMEAVEIIPVCH